jgi:hypothetical protein
MMKGMYRKIVAIKKGNTRWKNYFSY